MAAGSVLVRFQSSNRSAASISGGSGLPFDGILGVLLDAGGSGRVAVYGCSDALGDPTLSPQPCPTDARADNGSPAGYLYVSAPTNVTATVPLYECPPDTVKGIHAVPTVSTQVDCEQGTSTPGTFLGFALAPAGTLNRWLVPASNNVTAEWDTRGPVSIATARRVIALGYPLTAAGAHRTALSSCGSPSGDYQIVAAPETCGMLTTRAEGWIYFTPPATSATVPLYRCVAMDGTHSASVHTPCPGANSGTLLGYLPITPAITTPPPPPDTDHDGIADPADHCPARAAGRYDGDHDGCPGPYHRMHIRDSVGWAIPRRGVQLTKLIIEGVPHGGTVLLRCPSCHITQRRRAPGTKGTKNVRLTRILHHTLLPGHGYTIAITAPGYIGVLLHITALAHGSSDRARARANNHPLRRITRCLPAGSRKPSRHCATRPA